MFAYAVLLLCFALPAQPAKHVVLISIDGLAAYHLLNEELELPNIRELIAGGVWAASSETVFPSVTHPSHTSILTGVEPRRHGVLSNGMTNRETGERFHPTNKPHGDVVKARTIFDAAKAADLTTASFFWPETWQDPAIDYNLPEVFNDERKADIHSVAPGFLEELRGAGVPIDYYFRWYGSERRNAGDVILTEAAAYVLKAHKPALLAIHLVSTDGVQHQYGPHHYLSHASLTSADHCVGLLRQAAVDAGIDAETVFIAAADHGFHSVYQEANIDPVFRRAGLSGKVKLHGGGWSVAVELGNGFDREADLPALEQVFGKLQQLGLVQRVIGPGEMHSVGQPRYEESVYAPGHYFLIPDIDTHLVADRTSDSMERRPKVKPYHGHGYLPGHPRMYPALVLAGAGVKKGVTIGHTKNIDIAPTIARLLGIDMPDASGDVIAEALE